MLYDDLLAHLKRFPAAAPFLFIGSGLSRRYLGLEDWEGLLRRFAEVAGSPYEFYAASANGSHQKVAELIAEDLHDRWWKTEEFAESRALFQGKVSTRESGLKAEVARYVAATADQLSTDPLHVEELDLLKRVVVDGVITTNYDPLPRMLFPDFEVFVGQDELLFADLQGIGETYMIHGSHEEPDSLVLTTNDYERFGKRNPYLAAKLLTIFVEHPVVFLGYSLSDPNITTILRSIAAVLTNDRIKELQDRLLFVEWDPKATEPRITGTTVVADGFTIPVLSVTVPDFRDVFRALGALERRLPARILRQLKERVFELVQTNDPKKQLFVQDISADVDPNSVDVVFGVGAIEKLTTGYVGKSRDDLIADVLDDGDLDAQRVLDEVIPPWRSVINVPVFKYLRGAGLLDDEGALTDATAVHPRVAGRVTGRATRLLPPSSSGYRARAKQAAAAAGDFASLEASHDPFEALMALPFLPADAIDLDDLRDYLIEHRESLLVNGHSLQASAWVKAVCFYDWLKHGAPS